MSFYNFRLIGALTSKPHAFKARPWELKKFPSIDLNDSFGHKIKLEVKGNKIMRIIPEIDELVQDSWISDKTRFAFDGLDSQRLDSPLISKLVYRNNKWVRFFKKVNYYIAFSYIRFEIVLSRIIKNMFNKNKIINLFLFKAKQYLLSFCFFDSLLNYSYLYFKNNLRIFIKSKYLIKPYYTSVNGLISPETSLEGSASFKDLINSLGSGSIYNSLISHNLKSSDISFRHNYCFNSPLEHINEIGNFFFVGLNLRMENPALNFKMRKRSLFNRDSNIVIFGPAVNVTYPVIHLGSTVKQFVKLLEGNHKFCQEFWDVGYCTFFINEALFKQKGARSLKYLIDYISSLDWIFTHIFFYNYVASKSNSVGLMDLGLINSKYSNNQLINIKSEGYHIDFHLNTFLLNLNDSLIKQNNYQSSSDLLNKRTIVFQGTHGGPFLSQVDIALPSSHYWESGGSFINFESRPNIISPVLSFYKNSKPESIILDNLTRFLKKGFPWSSAPQVLEGFFNFDKVNYLNSKRVKDFIFIDKDLVNFERKYGPFRLRKKFNLSRFWESLPFNSLNSHISNFYITDNVSFNSKIMNNCTKILSVQVNKNYKD